MVSVSTVLPILALAGVASAADRRCTPAHAQVRISGDDYASLSADTTAACANACIADTRCVAYEHTNKLCVLFNTFQSDAFDASTNSLTVSARCMATADVRLLLTPRQNVDYAGLDIGSAYAATPTDCGATCQDTPGCYAYSWNNYNGGSCWMKSGKPDKVTPTDGSVVSGQVYTCHKPQFDADAMGTDLTSVLRSDWVDCCGVCRTTSGCVGFSWNNYNGGTCWLKSRVTGFSNNPGVIAAVM